MNFNTFVYVFLKTFSYLCTRVIFNYRLTHTKKTMKKTVLCALGIGAMMMLQSCYVQNVSVGMNPDEPMRQVAKVKNQQFIGGLVQPTKDKADVHVSDTRHFTMKTKITFWDGFLTSLTCGIYSPSTTYYYEPAK